MQLLLTSNGVANSSILKALTDLVEKDIATATLAFIPTAANVEIGDKGWLINDLVNCRSVGFRTVDTVDISALSKEQWLPRLMNADVIVVGGGQTPHLLNWFSESGLRDCLSSLLETRVYMGISAGSIAAGREAIREISNDLYGEDTAPTLGLANLIFLPHLNSKDFPKSREENIRLLAGELRDIYACDDETALKIVDGQVEIISEGNYLVLHLVNTTDISPASDAPRGVANA